MASARKQRLWIDNGSGTLTEISDQINNVDWTRDRAILDDTGLNEDDMQHQPGIRTNTLAINGRKMTGTSVSAWRYLYAAQDTAVTKTAQYWDGDLYYNGEAYVGALTASGDGKALATFSATLSIDDGWNQTAAAL